MRIELPVLLYADIDDAEPGPNETPLDVAKQRIYRWLGDPGEEIGIDIPAPSDLRISHARLYTSDVECCNSDLHFAIVEDDQELDRG